MALSEGKNRIMIFGPKRDGTYVVEFRTSDGETLAISVPVGETRVLKHFSGTHALRAFRSRWSVSATGCPMEKDYLIVKCASASRPSGQWKDDDFDVLADGVVVGRRMMLLARADRRTLALSTWRKKRRELEMSDQAPVLIGKRLAV